MLYIVLLGLFCFGVFCFLFVLPPVFSCLIFQGPYFDSIAVHHVAQWGSDTSLGNITVTALTTADKPRKSLPLQTTDTSGTKKKKE